MKLILLCLCIIGLLTEFGSSASDSSINENETLDYRLNTDIEPTDYVVELTPYFEDKAGKKAFTFDGKVQISIKTIKSNVDTITLHKHDLDITKYSLTNRPGFFAPFPWTVENINIEPKEYHNVTKKYTFKLAKPLTANATYSLNFEYTGNLQTDMHGFYRSSYKEGNETKWLASTQMEPVHARKVFPCFDEPRFKATFTIIINRPSHFAASVSNTPLLSSYKTSSGFVHETFAKTPRMSTYLVAFIVSEFKCRGNDANNFYVCSRPNAYDQTEYSFDVGQKILAKLDEVFDYKYNKQMSKMSMAALPDFAAGAMENWGLLTYRETALLYEPNVSTSQAQQRVATVVAHEQTHMWFGDLVTCEWWSHAWLNEGFARFFEYHGTAMVESTWDFPQQFVVDQVHSVFGDDSLETSLPLSSDVSSPEEIADRFGSISYNKGASVIRMFKHALGEDVFVAALQSYLKTNALKTAVPEQLFAEFQTAVGNDFNVTEVMSSWVYQPGYPVLNVKVTSDRKNVIISQKRFLRNNKDHDDQTLYKVPITFASNQQNTDFASTTPYTWLSGESIEIVLNEAIDWIVFNVQETGFYRVNYDEATWSAIAKTLHDSHSTIHVLNRAQIVDDALNLARANQLNYVQALNTIHYLQNETDYAPWKAAFNNFDFILARFKQDEVSILEEFILNLLNSAYEHLGFKPKESDTRLDIYNRNNILKYACRFGHRQCIADARFEFDQLLKGDYTIPVDLVPVVYCSVVAEGGEKEWNFLWDKFKSENVAAAQVTILNALGCTKQTDLIKKYFELILSDDIRLQDKHAALVSTMTHQQHIDSVLDFVIIQHKKIDTAFETETEVPTILSQVASRSTNSEQIDKIQKFAESNKLDSNKGLKTALENAKLNLVWAERNVPTIKDYVKPNSATTQTISCIVFMCLIFVSIFNY